MAFTVKNEVLVRVYVVLGIVVLVALAVAYKTVRISVVEGEKWRSKGQSLYIREVPVEAERGNILTEDGGLLATSMPFFDLAFDPNSSGMDTADWNQSIDSLSYCLARFVDPSFTPGGMRVYLSEQKAAIRQYLQQQKNEGRRYILIKKDATIAEKELISSFPLFNKGQFRGGFIAVPKYKRERPFHLLANRTIGYVNGDSIKVGLEGAFDDVLKGAEGSQMMYRVGDGLWIPLEDLAKIEPQPGSDIVTTLDMDLQGITESALSKAMYRHHAEYGVAILMEVKTGAVKAIANLSFRKDGAIWENYNYAIGSATEPGSTFKLASMLALLEDDYVDLEDSIDLEQGRTIYYNVELQDAYPHTLNNVSVEQAFAMSSNVGVSRLVDKYYGSNAAQFTKRLNGFFLNQPTGIEVYGEPDPFFKRPYNEEDGWSGTSLPWMSMGYELAVTPLQLLAFYNAVANDGVYVKPYIVKEVQEYGETVKKFPVTEVKGRIASRDNIRKAHRLLRAVVDSTYGTAYRLRSDDFTFAGKTGTAQLGYQRLENKTSVKGYQASFAGFFPAENPVYSCIVLVSQPKEAGIYGGQVALPVFKEIAEKTFRSNIGLYDVVNVSRKSDMSARQMPDYDAGNAEDIRKVLKELKMEYHNRSEGGWAVVKASQPDSLKLLKRPVSDKTVPSVIGMGLRDALFLLENRGLTVKVTGKYGKVRQQSVAPGSRAKGQTVFIRLG